MNNGVTDWLFRNGFTLTVEEESIVTEAGDEHGVVAEWDTMTKLLCERARRGCVRYPSSNPAQAGGIAEWHQWLVHGDGSRCEDGCDSAPDPVRRAIMAAIEARNEAIRAGLCPNCGAAAEHPTSHEITSNVLNGWICADKPLPIIETSNPDLLEATAIIARMIEAGLMRDKWKCKTVDRLTVEEMRSKFALERARNIVLALQGEFQLVRLPPESPSPSETFAQWESAKAEQFADNVVAIMASEHGCTSEMFEVLRPHIREAYATEGGITVEEITTLCCGDDEGDLPPELMAKYPLLNAVFEAPFTGALGWGESNAIGTDSRNMPCPADEFVRDADGLPLKRKS